MFTVRHPSADFGSLSAVAVGRAAEVHGVLSAHVRPDGRSVVVVVSDMIMRRTRVSSFVCNLIQELQALPTSEAVVAQPRPSPIPRANTL
ncbi:MAG TPA: hypothetical protein VK694_05530 [Verrucomicrobiae bacterium]|nr:hypothetical protein [Verrucomicrobiae bacterium]